MTEGHHQEWSLRLNLIQHGKNSPGPIIVRIGRLIDSMGGGAWPFLVGGVSCLVNFVDERDLSLLNSVKYDSYLITSLRDFACLTQGSLRQ